MQHHYDVGLSFASGTSPHPYLYHDRRDPARRLAVLQLASDQGRTPHGSRSLSAGTPSHGLARKTTPRAISTPPGNDNSRINLANPLGEIGPSAYNQPLNNVLSVVYDLPYGKGRMFGGNAPFLLQELLGGWQVTAINSSSSGLPVNVSYSPNSFQQVSPLLVARPNQAPGNAVLPKSQRVKFNGNKDIEVLKGSAFTPTIPNPFSLPTVNQP